MDGTKGFPGSMGIKRTPLSPGSPSPAAGLTRAHLCASHPHGACGGGWRLPVLCPARLCSCSATPCDPVLSRRHTLAELGLPTVLSSPVSATSPDLSPVSPCTEVSSMHLLTAPACELPPASHRQGRGAIASSSSGANPQPPHTDTHCTLGMSLWDPPQGALCLSRTPGL